MTKLIFVVYTPDEQRLEATVEDADGKRRRVDYRWRSKDASPPPDTWWESVCGEVEFQRAEDHARKKGRILF